MHVTDKEAREIIREACESHGLTAEQFHRFYRSNSPRPVAQARREVAKILRDRGCTFQSIAATIGYTHHSSVMHALEKLPKDLPASIVQVKHPPEGFCPHCGGVL